MPVHEANCVAQHACGTVVQLVNCTVGMYCYIRTWARPVPMKKRGSQSSLTEFFSGFKKSRLSAEELSLERNNSASSEVSNDSGNSQLESAENTTDGKCASNTVPEAETVDDISCNETCDCTGCTIGAENGSAFQPKEPGILCAFERNGRKFLPTWYDKYQWLTLCVKRCKVFCSYCRYAREHNLITFATRGDLAFSIVGFDNYKKAMEKFLHHEGSSSHQEAVMKCNAISAPSIRSRLSSLLCEQQQHRRSGLLKQLQAMQFLLRQGLALRGHYECEGNLYQLLQMWARDNEIVCDWLKSGRFLSHDHVNELITLMGHDVLRRVLDRVKSAYPPWYGIIADEASDVVYNEQLNLSVRYVDDNYDVHEDSVGLFQLPSTDAATIAGVIKDILIRLSLPLSLCRGQAYDGAAAMQGKRSGVSTRIKNEAPAAVSVHCFAHSLNLCLQDVGRRITVIRDAMDVVREIVKLINFSPKRKTLFSSKSAESNQAGGTLKPLCPTRWTVRAAAMKSVIDKYTVLMDTMQEVNQTTRDEHGLKAGGVLSALENFSTLFGLRLGYLFLVLLRKLHLFYRAKIFPYKRHCHLFMSLKHSSSAREKRMLLIRFMQLQKILLLSWR